jgi:hypothetical protein
MNYKIKYRQFGKCYKLFSNILSLLVSLAGFEPYILGLWSSILPLSYLGATKRFHSKPVDQRC